MKKIILKELNYQDLNIKFNNGLNYIIGSNGSGKTTIFNLVQFVLGLKKEIKNTVFSNSFTTSVNLLCIIGAREVRFERSLNSEYISIQYDSENVTVKYMSQKLKEVYDYLFEPFFVYENEIGAAYDIIKNSFISELQFDLNRGRNETLKKILGVNVSYIKQANIDYRDFKKNIQYEKKAIELLEDFVNKINFTNTKMQKVDSSGLKELLDKEYKIIMDEHIKNIEFLRLAENTLISREDFLEGYYNKRISHLEHQYWEIMDRLDVKTDSNSFRDFFNIKGLNKTSSGSQIYLEFLCFMLTVIRNINDDYHNGCGLLINDLAQNDYDNISKYKLQKVIRNVTESGSLQYIEFTTNQRKELLKDVIIFDLDSLEKFI